jgi:hypothetical protein
MPQLVNMIKDPGYSVNWAAVETLVKQVQNGQ